MILFRCYHIKQ